MSALPLFWGEEGPSAALDPRDQRAPVMRLLMDVHDVQPLDTLLPEALLQARVLLLIQPRLLAPQELVALDAWVRKGGRLVLFADPELRWRSHLPHGDPRRPPPVTLLDPLFSHWQVSLSPPDKPVEAELAGHSVAVSAAGRWTVGGPDCSLESEGLLARCVLGKGQAILIGDADMLDLPDGASASEPAFAVLLDIIASTRS